MNKKINTIVASVCLLINSYVFAANPGIGDKVSELKEENYRLFGGYNFGDVSKDLHKESMTERVNSEIDYVIASDKEKGNTGKYAIVGHSQGGERVLAYATMLERRMNDPSLTAAQRADAKASFNRLGAVITVSGIDKGLKAIENNFVNFKSKLTEDANIWINGFHGLARASLITTIAEKIALNKIGIPTPDSIINVVNENFPKIADSYFMAGWNGASYNEIPEIYDMVPGSDFIEKNVSSTTVVPVKVKTGTRTYKTWEKVAPLWWWWVEHSEPIYTVYDTYKDNPKFSSSLPVGYIVGTDSNTLGLTEEKEDGIRETCSTLANVFNAGQIINHAECYTTLGIGFLTGHYTAYQDCCEARDWFDNIDDELNEIKGSTENDGLVAKECQFYPKRFYNSNTGKYEDVHTKVLGDTSGKGYVEVNKNHVDIDCDETYENEVKWMLKNAGLID